MFEALNAEKEATEFYVKQNNCKKELVQCDSDCSFCLIVSFYNMYSFLLYVPINRAHKVDGGL